MERRAGARRDGPRGEESRPCDDSRRRPRTASCRLADKFVSCAGYRRPLSYQPARRQCLSAWSCRPAAVSDGTQGAMPHRQHPRT
ncbi:hypothetical protein GLA29479_2460 [Lysobacter antibioticus]|uniref:Uncharacterized protein n=1 Tax=Lysobacter antibioticus TaxID=84531 RepID=A0A0S2FDN3_LYSAN|nr:hypothetical protein GLA29479_2460 [Lysobacter antibioticus]ALN81549.1 hypothetical protein LA76x_3424 [Lysobacter antibioticus]